jgi:fumarate reductase subunit C
MSSRSKRCPYHRPVLGWWRRDTYYFKYLAMEATSLVVALYALILLVGVYRLTQGEAAFNGWLEALRSPLSVVSHFLILLVFVYHTLSWFKIMPKTLPNLYWNGVKVPQPVITRGGVVLSVVLNLLLVAALAGVMS